LTCRVITHCGIVLTIPGITALDRGRPVFCGTPEPRVSLDPASGERIGYIVRVEGKDRALVQILPAQDEHVDLSLGKIFHPVETSESKQMRAERSSDTPRVKKIAKK